MKIWLVQIAESTPHDDGGTRRLLRTGILAEFLQARGHEVIWWTSDFDHFHHCKRNGGTVRRKVKERYHIHYLDCLGYKKNRSFARLFDQKYVASEFAKEVSKCEEMPDIILSSLPVIELCNEAISFANEHNIPVFLDIRDLWPDIFMELFPPSLKALIYVVILPMKWSLARACKRATGILGITGEFVDWAVTYSSRKRTPLDQHFPMSYIRNEILDEKFRVAIDFWEGNDFLLNDDSLKVLYVGSFTRTSDFDTVFEAAKLLKERNANVKIIFCGIGDRTNHIESNCRSISNCKFGGWVDSAKIKAALTLCDIGLVPYVETANYINNIPNKPPEYMSEGVALALSLKSGKLWDLIKETQCGFSYFGDPKKLCDELMVLENDRDKLLSMKTSASEVFSNCFDGEKTYIEMASFLESAAVLEL